MTVGQKPASANAARLADLIRAADSVVALTGAGISVPSGIPDFRTPGTGLWENVDPFEVAHVDAFHNDTPRFWSFYRPRFDELGAKQPNGAHRALAELEASGRLDAVITQNIDRLHSRAGSQRVVEVHGSIDSCSCTTCGSRYGRETLPGLFDEAGVATCSCCMGKVKPDVVLFGEFLPEAPMADAQRLCEDCDLLVCIGSSLEVYPVAGLPAAAIARGARLAIVTKGSTPYDRDAAVKLDGDVVDELEGVLAAL